MTMTTKTMKKKMTKKMPHKNQKKNVWWSTRNEEHETCTRTRTLLHRYADGRCMNTYHVQLLFIVRSIVSIRCVLIFIQFLFSFFFLSSSHATLMVRLLGVLCFFFVQPNADIEIFIVGQDQRLNEHDTWYHTHEAYMYVHTRVQWTPYTYQLPTLCVMRASARALVPAWSGKKKKERQREVLKQKMNGREKRDVPILIR